ncbi:hypothetical protein NDU88_007696 [Pleurodeles waltl]|uniref:Uncharacterized protein n=1 Tax=Pleurodeles waltl TaxID=8319 RepID=A0AAV7QSD5_PLEWA|nr:hypothetical protein NDU88_007696 [Pleurodeles waltl]
MSNEKRGGEALRATNRMLTHVGAESEASRTRTSAAASEAAAISCPRTQRKRLEHLRVQLARHLVNPTHLDSPSYPS